ncbi:hypothetical protein MGN70_001696 [Eutypa lata]|nr:hypothetical protein MGN70_001696 [Eutypa lata]
MQFIKYALAAFSIGSAFAAPTFPVNGDAVSTVTSVANVQVLVGTVSSVKSKVEQELGSIKQIASGTVTQADVPTIQASLTVIRKQVLSIEVDLNPLVKGKVVPLVAGDLKIVLGLVNDIVALVDGVEATVDNLLKTLPASKCASQASFQDRRANMFIDLQKLLQAELTNVLSVLNPVLSPVLDLVSGLLGTNTGALVNEINGVIVQLNGLLGGLLNPLLGTVTKIL